ncbi:MAG: hypothetical protein ACE5HS_21585 [bacterium]
MDGANWKAMETISVGDDNICAYKIMKAETGESVMIEWWNWNEEPGYTEGDTKIVSLMV